LLFHFPHVRDATVKGVNHISVSVFSFPACTRDATSGIRTQSAEGIFISRLYARCNINLLQVSIMLSYFHFPLVREMQQNPPLW